MLRKLHIRRCECGQCNELVLTPDVNNQPIYYRKGHMNKVIKILTNRTVKERTSRERGLLILKNVLRKDKCEVNNELCNGRLQCHHIDKNPFNNSMENLLLLCDTHHGFADIRNLSIEELRDLKLTYYISSNKRRYKNVE